jgi:hypothetical protein
MDGASCEEAPAIMEDDRPMTSFQKLIRSIGMKLVHRFGTRLQDAETGEVLGRVLIVPWRGRIQVIGLEELTVRPTFRTQQRLTYWKQDLGFTKVPLPDFPNEAEQHQKKSEVHRSKNDGPSGLRSQANVSSYMMASTLLSCL